MAASGVAALLSLALLVFPSREVEAKKTYLSLDTGSRVEQLPPNDAAPTDTKAFEDTPPPFADLAPSDTETDAEADTQTPDQTDAGGGLDQNAVAKNANRREITVGDGDTLSTIFNEAGLAPNVVHDVLASSKDAATLSRLRVGQILDFQLDDAGGLRSLLTQLNDLESVSLSKEGDRYLFKKEISKPDIRNRYAHGVIDSSLFLAAKRAGLSHELIMALTNIFGYDIDFAMDLRKGDQFEVIYEEKAIKGERIGDGNILAARFTNNGQTYTAVRYTNKQGVSGYFTADGNSMRKAFLRMPVDFARISSFFSLGRMHPILNKIRAHKGVDYAAPRGTPIKAAGDGKVILAGRKGGYGNTIIIQHSGRYRTLYGHMQGFAQGIRSGSNVKQGQIIGFIGTTGLSTGPHLHYEFQVDGVQVDPLNAKLPMAAPIAASERKRFMQLSQPLMAHMDEEKATVLALNKR